MKKNKLDTKYLSGTDKELVTLLTRGDEDAFKELYLRYKTKLWYYCFGFLKSEEEVDDIVQEVFIRLWELRSFIDPGLSVSSFMYTMAKNRVLNYFRDMDVKLQAQKVLSRNQPVRENSIETELAFSEYWQILEEAIGQLPPQRQKIFRMSRMEHLTHKEIAAQLEISVHTVQDHISESLRFIKRYFSERTGLVSGMAPLH